MRRTLKVAVSATALLALTLVVGVLAFLFFVVGNACDRFESVLAIDGHGRTVTSTFEACTTIGTTKQESVDLVTTFGRHHRIMTFVPWGGEMEPNVRKPFEPVVTWAPPTAMHISIGTVSAIIEKHDNVDGVDVTYDIGTILHK